MIFMARAFLRAIMQHGARAANGRQLGGCWLYGQLLRRRVPDTLRQRATLKRSVANAAWWITANSSRYPSLTHLLLPGHPFCLTFDLWQIVTVTGVQRGSSVRLRNCLGYLVAAEDATHLKVSLRWHNNTFVIRRRLTTTATTIETRHFWSVCRDMSTVIRAISRVTQHLAACDRRTCMTDGRFNATFPAKPPVRWPCPWPNLTQLHSLK